MMTMIDTDNFEVPFDYEVCWLDGRSLFTVYSKAVPVKRYSYRFLFLAKLRHRLEGIKGNLRTIVPIIHESGIYLVGTTWDVVTFRVEKLDKLVEYDPQTSK